MMTIPIETTDGRSVLITLTEHVTIREVNRNETKNTTEIVLSDGNKYEMNGLYNFCKSMHGTPYLLTDKECESRDTFALYFFGFLFIVLIFFVIESILEYFNVL